jgi:hypothetical protein
MFPADAIDTAEKQNVINNTFVGGTRATYARTNPRYTVVCTLGETLTEAQVTEIVRAGMEQLGYSFDVAREQITDDEFTALF